jgi:uncharacterized protein (DUF302 family)
MRSLILGFLTLVIFTPLAFASDGMIKLKSTHDVENTADRLEAVLISKGMTVFARIDHAKGAMTVGATLRPTELVIFGNPKIGSKLMNCGQTVAIDLPQKALIFEDEKGQVWFTYNNPEYLANRHDLKGCEAVIKKIEGALGKFAKASTQ